MTTRVYEVWQYAGKIRGNERAHIPPTYASRGFDVTYDIRGKSAHFIIVTNDCGISRDAAIEFALAIHVGKYTTFSVDLSLIGAPKVRKE